MPFNVACGHCLNCEEGKSAFCTEVNPGFVRDRFFFPYHALMRIFRPEGKRLFGVIEPPLILYVRPESSAYG